MPYDLQHAESRLIDWDYLKPVYAARVNVANRNAVVENCANSGMQKLDYANNDRHLILILSSTRMHLNGV